jgi:diguanylate cyclase (GGDEF)-like protein
MSTPLVYGQELVGVLALYSVDVDAFNENHRRILEVVGRQVSQTVHNALSFERHRASDLRDRATGLPNVRHFERMFAAASTNVLPEDRVSVVSVTVKPESKQLSSGGLTITDRAIETVAQAVRRALRGGDLLFRYASNELVVLLTQTDAATADLVAERIREATAAELSSHTTSEFSVCVALGVATAPVDGLSVHDLVEAARARDRFTSGPGTLPSVH